MNPSSFLVGKTNHCCRLKEFLSETIVQSKNSGNGQNTLSMIEWNLSYLLLVYSQHLGGPVCDQAYTRIYCCCKFDLFHNPRPLCKSPLKTGKDDLMQFLYQADAILEIEDF